MVVHHVRKIIGREAIRFYEDLVVQLAILDGDAAVNTVVEGGSAAFRYALADHGRITCFEPALNLGWRQKTAGIITFRTRAFFLGFVLLAKTEVGRAAFDQLFGVTTIDTLRLALALDIGLSLIHISEPTRLGMISYAVFCL